MFIVPYIYLVFIMAALQYTRKLCHTCSCEMHIGDYYSYCLECLTTTHDSGDCGFCKAICMPIYSCLLGIIGDALQAYKWPVD